MITENPKQILLADDSMLIRARLGNILEEAGHHVTLAFDGAGVIDTLKGGNIDFDLIILDIDMPHINGFAVLDWMNTNGYMEGFPVLCMTDFSNINKVSWKATELGAEGVLIKGLTPGQTINAINKTLFKATKCTREQTRIPTSIEAQFEIASNKYKGMILDVSRGGIFLRTDARLFMGSTMSLNFTIPGYEEVTLTPKGKVNWITPGDKKNDFFTGAGVQFKVITESNKQVISKFIDKHQTSSTDKEKKQA